MKRLRLLLVTCLGILSLVLQGQEPSEGPPIILPPHYTLPHPVNPVINEETPAFKALVDSMVTILQQIHGLWSKKMITDITDKNRAVLAYEQASEALYQEQYALIYESNKYRINAWIRDQLNRKKKTFDRIDFVDRVHNSISFEAHMRVLGEEFGYYCSGRFSGKGSMIEDAWNKAIDRFLPELPDDVQALQRLREELQRTLDNADVNWPASIHPGIKKDVLEDYYLRALDKKLRGFPLVCAG